MSILKDYEQALRETETFIHVYKSERIAKENIDKITQNKPEKYDSYDIAQMKSTIESMAGYRLLELLEGKE